MHKELLVSSGALASLHKRIFPGKNPKVKAITYILQHYGYKYCSKCKNCKKPEEFYTNNTNYDKLTTECAYCMDTYVAVNRAMYNSYEAERRSSKLLATPTWGQQGIKEFYINCPIGYEVDHIIPLKNKIVCGLHVVNNLQYLSAEANRIKSNKYEW